MEIAFLVIIACVVWSLYCVAFRSGLRMNLLMELPDFERRLNHLVAASSDRDRESVLLLEKAYTGTISVMDAGTTFSGLASMAKSLRRSPELRSEVAAMQSLLASASPQARLFWRDLLHWRERWFLANSLWWALCLGPFLWFIPRLKRVRSLMVDTALVCAAAR